MIPFFNKSHNTKSPVIEASLKMVNPIVTYTMGFDPDLL